ncbi:MAG TPA: SAM-dependent methyltransferase, partial [Ktedonobacteraceae bacterium]|nr:SAM-dependent methyltransferase [Ktedonobacteraceae bacterium]
MTTSTAISILGLGPGRWEDLTIQARAILEQAAADKNPVFFRTLIHPIIEPLKQAIPDLRITSFDSFYDEATNWDTLYLRIAQEIFTQAEQHHPLIYAVPGHPLIGEASVKLILQKARERNLRTRIVAGLSFLEPVCAALELDPFASGLQIIDATDLASLTPDEIAGKIIPTVPVVIAHIYHRRLASSVKLALGECYPDEWPVKLVSSIDLTASEAVQEMPLYELDHNNPANEFNTLYVPPLSALDALRVPETLRYITMR